MRIILRGIPQMKMMWKPSPPDISRYPLSTNCSPTTTPGSKGLQGFQIALVLSVWAVRAASASRALECTFDGRSRKYVSTRPASHLPPDTWGLTRCLIFCFFGFVALEIFWPLSFYPGLSLFLLLSLIGSRLPLHTEKQKLHGWIWGYIRCQPFETKPHWDHWELSLV